MPTYEYACRACNQVFEVFQSMRDAPLSKCPNCGQPGVKRLIGRGAGVIFKGSGFYETDYKRAPSKKEGAESTSGGSETKQAASTPAAPASKPSTGGDAPAKSSTQTKAN